VLNGEEVPFLNYFDTPKITQDNMGEFHQAGLLSLVEFHLGARFMSAPRPDLSC
jgi:hypothetical protein